MNESPSEIATRFRTLSVHVQPTVFIRFAVQFSYAIASLYRSAPPLGLVVFCEKVGADTLPLLRAQVALVQFGGFDVLRQGGQILELPLAQVADESLPINKSLVVVGPTASALARPLRIRILPPSVRANGSAEQSRVRGNRR